MKKRIISLLLVLSMLLCVLPAASAAEAPKFTRYSISLNKSIAINFKVKLADIEGENPSVTFEKGGETYGPYTTYGVDGDYAVFTFRDLSPNELAIPVKATLNTSAGSTFISKSVKDYCESMLDNESSSGNLKKLIVDLLNYGAAFQTYKGETTELVNADLTDAQKALGTQAAPALSSDYYDKTEGAIKGVGVSLQDSVVLYFVPGDDKGVATVKVNDTTVVEPSENGWFYFDKLNPGQMRNVVNVQAYDSDGAPIGGTLRYSIVSYAHDTAKDEEASAVLKELVNAMMKYGDSAATYVRTPDADPVVKTTLKTYNFDNMGKWDWVDCATTDNPNSDYGQNDNGQLEMVLNAECTQDLRLKGLYDNTWQSKHIIIEFDLIYNCSDPTSEYVAGFELTNWASTRFAVDVQYGYLRVNYEPTGILVGTGTHKVAIECYGNHTFDVYLDGRLAKEDIGYVPNVAAGWQQLLFFAKGNNTVNPISVCFDNLVISEVK